jgi:hypothetical protein
MLPMRHHAWLSNHSFRNWCSRHHLEQKLMYDLCKIAYFPYKSKEPTKLTHMSCFFGLKGLIWYLQPKLGLKGLIWSLWPAFGLQGLIWSLQPKLGLKGLIWFWGPKLNLQGLIKSPWSRLIPLSSLHFRTDSVSISLSTFDKRRLGGYCVVSNCNRAQSPTHCIFGPNPFKLGPITCVPPSLFSM